MLHLSDQSKSSRYLNESFLKEFFNHSSDGIVFFNKKQTVVECNAAFQLLSGFSRNEIIQSNIKNLFHFLNLDENIIIKKIFNGEKVEIRDHTFAFKENNGTFDGCIIPVVEKGTVEGGVLIFSKTSEEKPSISKQELHYSEERFRLIAKATNDSMYDWNFENNELWFNNVFIEHFGSVDGGFYKGYEFWKNHIHPEDRERVVSGLEQAIQSGEESWKDEYRFLSTQGYYAFIMDRGYIIHDVNNRPLRMVGAMIEITDVEKTEDKLKRSQENYQFLAESMPQLVWITNEKGEAIYYNRKWTEYTGQEFDQYSKMGWTDVIHPEDYPHKMAAWSNALAIGCEYKFEYRLRSKYGEYRWFLSRAIPMRNSEGAIVKWVGTSTDIHDEKILLDNVAQARTALKEMNRKLNSRNEQLKKINKELDNFIFAASHDLRSPVRNIESLLELLISELNGNKNKVVEYYLELLLRSIQNLKTTIQDLTEVTKIEEGSDKEEIEIQEIIDDILFSIKDLVDKSHAEIRYDLKIKKIVFSRKNLRSILYNLISNSIKYKIPNRDPYIEITCARLSENTVEIAVKDNGMGIKQEDLPKVFTPFKRMHHQVEGSGMGMSIVKRIVDNNNGSIEIESVVNKGTTIKIILGI